MRLPHQIFLFSCYKTFKLFNLWARVILLFVLALSFSAQTWSEESIVRLGVGQKSQNLGLNLFYFADDTSRLTIEDILKEEYQSQFKRSLWQNPHFGFSEAAYWLKFSVDFSKANHEAWYFMQRFALADYVAFYEEHSGTYTERILGDLLPFEQREVEQKALLFRINNIDPAKTEQTYYVRIHDQGTINVDFHLFSESGLAEQSYTEQIVLGLYYGCMAVMILYNLFLWVSIRERSYFYYLVYVVANVLFQFSLNGYSFQYLWPNAPIMNSLFVYSVFIGYHGMFHFARYFLETEKYSRFFDVTFKALLWINIAIVISSVFISARAFFQILSLLSIIYSMLMFVAGVVCWYRGNQSARFYVLAWFFFIAGLIIYPLQNLGLLEASVFTNYSMQIGSGAEIVLLSLALADRINRLKAERARLEAEARKQLEQANVILEKQVAERTKDLKESLDQLEVKHVELKATQSQLVQAEKMSSLGTLVAGVAHEINNPSHFAQVGSQNLRSSLGDFQSFIQELTEDEADEEIENVFREKFSHLNKQLDVVQDGTKRISRIVGDLRVFSRLDEDESKSVNIVEGFRTTMNLVKANYSGNVKMTDKLEKSLELECRSAQLNQVFMNILVNACQAVEAKQLENSNQSSVEKGNVLVEADIREGEYIITISDDGIGMDLATQEKLFEPFFTTKPIGEGTGLGMSISFGIIQAHKGDIKVESQVGEGTKVTIILPLETSSIDAPDLD